MWLKELRELIYPSVSICLVCNGKEIYPGLPGCEECLMSLGLRFRKLNTSYPAYALAPYSGRLKELLNQVKYHNNYQLALTFGEIMGLAAKEEPDLKKIDFLLPVPLYHQRQKQRGFNQALALAQGIAQVWYRPIFHGFYRVKDTVPLSNLTPKERRENLKDAFIIKDFSMLKAKHFLIIDDIFTTGITFKTIATFIKQYHGNPAGLFMTQSSMDF